MQADTNTKLCWNCEGRVSHEEENCSFCGVYLSPTIHSSTSDNITPPYSLEEEADSPPPAPYADERQEAIANVMREPKESEKMAEPIREASSNLFIILSLTASLAGSIFFLFGFI